MFCKSLLNTVNVCSRFINFVNCYNNFNSCCLSMVNSFYSLWHNTIICCYNKDCNIC